MVEDIPTGQLPRSAHADCFLAKRARRVVDHLTMIDFLLDSRVVPAIGRVPVQPADAGREGDDEEAVLERDAVLLLSAPESSEVRHPRLLALHRHERLLGLLAHLPRFPVCLS